MDGSKRSAHANAYFTGFGAAKRVVFYDTLLAKLSPGEVDAVLAHELGHFKHRHIIKRIVALFAMSLLGFALLGWLSTPGVVLHRLGVRPTWPARPTMRWRCCCSCWRCRCSPSSCRPCSRSCRASTSSRPTPTPSAQTSGQDLSTALLKLYEDNASTLTPDPVYVKFYYSPPAPPPSG
jgi:STE24 endopeptidase